MNDEAVYRTAPATPGLLTNIYIKKDMTKNNLGSSQYRRKGTGLSKQVHLKRMIFKLDWVALLVGLLDPL